MALHNKASRREVANLQTRLACLEALSLFHTSTRASPIHRSSSCRRDRNTTCSTDPAGIIHHWKTIRAYVYRRTGKNLSFKQIFECTQCFTFAEYSTLSIIQTNVHSIPPSNVKPDTAQSEDGSGSTTNPSGNAQLPDNCSILVCASASPSMSRRRLASNIPVLHCRVDIPPVPSFSNHSSLPTSCSAPHPALSSSSSSTSLVWSLCNSRSECSGENPVTPTEQILHTPNSPPKRLLQRTSKLRRELPLSTSGYTWRPLNNDDSNANTPDLPLTHLEPPSPNGLDHESSFSASCSLDLTQRFLELKINRCCSPLSSNNTRTSSTLTIVSPFYEHTPAMVARCRRSSPPSLPLPSESPPPRHLSHQLQQRANIPQRPLQPPKGTDLASLLFTCKTLLVSSPLIRPNYAVASTSLGSPVVHSGSDYFCL